MELKDRKDLNRVLALFNKEHTYNCKQIEGGIDVVVEALDGHEKKLFKLRERENIFMCQNALEDADYNFLEINALYMFLLAGEEETPEEIAAIYEKYGKSKAQKAIDIYDSAYEKGVLMLWDKCKHRLVKIGGLDIDSDSKERFPYGFKAEAVDQIEKISFLSTEDNEDL